MNTLLRLTASFFLIIYFSPSYSNQEDYFAQTGYTGLLRIPNANTLDYRQLFFLINKEENVDYEIGHQLGAHNTFLLGVGLSDFLEFSVQNTWKRFHGEGGYNTGASSDLSFSTKIQFDRFLPDYFPSIAIGVQDLDNQPNANFHGNMYGVMTFRPWNPLQISLGYGQASDNNQMGDNFLNGIFYGMEWQVIQYLDLLAEFDGTGYNYGFRVKSPTSWLPRAWKAGFYVQQHSTSETQGRDNRFFGGYLNIPLANDPPPKHHKRTSPTPLVIAANHTIPIKKITKNKTKKPLEGENPTPSPEEIIFNSLKQHGFENTKLGKTQKTWTIAFENNVFNWNELDALGIALGEISKVLSEPFILYLLNKQIPVIRIDANGKTVREFYLRKRSTPQLAISQHNLMSQYKDTMWFMVDLESSAFKPRFTISPNLRSTLGTEWGVLDYSLASSINISTDLWQGASIEAQYLKRLTTSDDVEDGNPFTQHEDGFDQVLFHQALWLPYNIFNQTSLGLIYFDFKGVLNQTRYAPPSAENHTFDVLVGEFENKENSFRSQPKLFRYHWSIPRYDLQLGFEIGEYWFGDNGFKLLSHHWFGDTRVSFEFSKSESTFAGLYFSLPLTPRKNMKPKGFQVTGNDFWIWGYKTRISEANYLDFNQNVGALIQSHHIDKVYFNKGRLSASYIKSNYLRLISAFDRWVINDYESNRSSQHY